MRVVQALQAIDVSSLSKRSEADKLLESAVKSPNVRAFLLQNLIRNPNGTGYTWRANLECIHRSLDQLGAFDVPDGCPASKHETLFVYGTASNYVQESNTEHMSSIRKWFPNGKLHSFEGSGHWLHAERPDEFRALVAEFFGIKASQDSRQEVGKVEAAT